MHVRYIYKERQVSKVKIYNLKDSEKLLKFNQPPTYLNIL